VSLTNISRLTASPGPMLKHPQGGANYHAGDQIITHLNHALGPSGWDWEPIEHGWERDADEVWVLGKLTGRVIELGIDGDEHVTTTTKTERGWAAVKRRRSDGTLVSIGDDFKSADTDALKRCARLLGVGLDAWEKEATRPQAKPAIKTCDAPHWNARWHATVKGTRFESDEVRHNFIKWYSAGEFSSLAEWLAGATDDDAETLIATITNQIEVEAKRSAGAA
jgi:hypothetical protein